MRRDASFWAAFGACVAVPGGVLLLNDAGPGWTVQDAVEVALGVWALMLGVCLLGMAVLEEFIVRLSRANVMIFKLADHDLIETSDTPHSSDDDGDRKGEGVRS